MTVLQDILVPQESVNDQTLIVLELLFKTGDRVSKNSVIAELETSKMAISIESEVEGFIQYHCKQGDELSVNALIARVTDEKPDEILQPVKPKQQTLIAKEVHHQAEVSVFSNRALELIKSAKIELDAFKGNDFISGADVENFLKGSNNQKQRNRPSLPVGVGPIMTDDFEKVELLKIPSSKRREAEYLSSVQSTGLRSTVNVQVNVSSVLNYVNDHLRYFRNSLLPIVIYESGRLLLKYREFNAYFSNEHIAFYKKVNVGFAADIGKGLKVLKIADTNLKSILEIEEEVFNLSSHYIDDQLTLEQLTDITFTITDLSSEGVFSFTPLINMKNSAILGISSIDSEGKCIISMSFDHRVSEGKQVALFLTELKNRIESYSAPVYSQKPESNLNSIACYRCFKTLNDDIAQIGFAKCITPQGAEGYICQSCFKGF